MFALHFTEKRTGAKKSIGFTVYRWHLYTFSQDVEPDGYAVTRATCRSWGRWGARASVSGYEPTSVDDVIEMAHT